MLVPLLPRAAYFPDFLTPWQASNGLEAGLDAILHIPRARVTREVQQLARVHRDPPGFIGSRTATCAGRSSTPFACTTNG
jgi:hypothetical protein